MSEGFSSRSSSTNVYTFDTHTGKLSYATMLLPSLPLSRSMYSEDSSRTHGRVNADAQMPAPGEGSLRIVEEIPIQNGRTVYFVAKLDSKLFSRHGFMYGLESCLRRAKRHAMDMERLVWKLEAALAEDDGADYEAYVIFSCSTPAYDPLVLISTFDSDVDEPEGEALADSGYESGDERQFDISGVTTLDPSPPNINFDEDSRRAQDLAAEEGRAEDTAPASLSSDSSDESVTFDPPPSSASRTEELAPSATSATHLYAPLQSTSPSVSALSSDDSSAIDDPSMVAGDPPSSPLPHPESSCVDGSICIEVSGLGCPATEEVPLCPACYGGPIRLVWGDGSSEESLSDLVDDLLGDIDCPFDEFEAGALAAAQPSGSVDVPVCSPIIAADWSLSHALASVARQRDAISGAGSSSSMSSLFSERQEARAGPGSESEEGPLAEVVKRRRRRTGKDATTWRRETIEARGTPESDESVEIPLSTLLALRVRKGKARRQPIRRSGGGSTGHSPATQQDPPSESRKRKRRRDDEKEDGEISKSDPDPGSESEPDIPLSQALASRRTSQCTLGHGPPPAKRRRCTQAGSTEQRRLSSREGNRSRRSWVHRRWEERLRLRHAQNSQQGRRGIRIMSTDETLLRRGMRAAMALHRGVTSS